MSMHLAAHLEFTVPQAAARLGLSPAKVRQFVKGPTLNGIQRGRRIYITGAQLQSFLERR